MFLETAREVGERYDGRVAIDDRIVDACAMQLVLNPWQFDVHRHAPTCSATSCPTRSPGWSAGSAWRPAPTSATARRSSRRCTARRRTSPARASPIRLALLLAAALMLDHVGRQDLATRLRTAIGATLTVDQVRTGDLGGKATTAELTSALIGHIERD